MPHISRQARANAERAAQLAAYWDDLVEPALGTSPQTLAEPDLASLIGRLRQLDARDERLNPDPAFAQRLLSDLFGQPASPPTVVSEPLAGQPPRHRLSHVATPRFIRPSRWLPALELAAVALLLLMLVSSYPGRSAFFHGTGPAATPAAATASVPMLGGNPARTNEQPGPGPSSLPVVRWVATYSGIVSSPAVVNGVVYASTASAVVAVDAATGKEKWHAAVAGSQASSPAVANGIVYIGIYTDDGSSNPSGNLLALDAASGQQLWTTAVGVANVSAPVVAAGSVYIAGDSKGVASLFAIDARTGAKHWQFSLGADVGRDLCQCAPFSAAVANGVVYVGSAHSLLYALDAGTGNERWQANTGGTLVSIPSVAGHEVFVAAFGNPKAVPPQLTYNAFDAASGQMRWRRTLPVPSAGSLPIGVAVAGGIVYLIGPDRTGTGIQAVDAASGKTRWVTHDLGMAPSMTPVFADGVIYAGDKAGSLAAIDAKNGNLLWRVTADSMIGWSPTVVDGSIYFGTVYDKLYSLVGTPGAQVATPSGYHQLLPDQPCPPLVGRSSSDQAVPGTPAASIVPGAPFTGQALSKNALPVGQPPAAPLIISALYSDLYQTVQQLINCAVAGGHDRARAFYSNDYLRRFGGTPSPNGFWWGTPGAGLEITDARVLPDGRTGAIVTVPGSSPLFVIFVQQQGRWLIDEIVPILASGGTPTPMATPNQGAG